MDANCENKLQLGYCTNVHSGANFNQMWLKLKEFAIPVKNQFRESEAMGIGLWFSANSASQVLKNGLHDFRDWLQESGLVPFTFNGFPYGDFHQPVVKHKVYAPNWGEPSRTQYTLELVRIMDELLPEGETGSISTVPIAWDDSRSQLREHRTNAANELMTVARELASLESRTGRRIVLSIEPEPGCSLQRGNDVVEFFHDYLLVIDEQLARNYLTVCHDICHAAVMFEEQDAILTKYQEAGIQVGKVQVSSAIVAPFYDMSPSDVPAAVDQLREFAEDRYLHQTVRKNHESGETQFVEDLPQLIGNGQFDQSWQLEEWRVHFHVPLFLESFGMLKTSQGDVAKCLDVLRRDSDVTHYEVETYAWGVLPQSLQPEHLSDGIAEELRWLENHLHE